MQSYLRPIKKAKVQVAATTTSQVVAVPAGGNRFCIVNRGNNDIVVCAGNNTAAAVLATDYTILARSKELIKREPGETHIAVRTHTSTSDVEIIPAEVKAD